MASAGVEYDRIYPICIMSDAYWEPVPGRRNRAYIFEFGDDRARMTEVDINTGRIICEGVDNHWFSKRALRVCPMAGGQESERASVEMMFNLARRGYRDSIMRVVRA